MEEYNGQFVMAKTVITFRPPNGRFAAYLALRFIWRRSRNLHTRHRPTISKRMCEELPQ